MALIDFDKFLASFITEMKKYSPITSYNIPGCIKKALDDQGLEYKDGEIVKSQRRVSAEAKENGYGESEEERIRKEIIAILQYKYEKFPNDPKYCNAPQWIAWLEKQGKCETDCHSNHQDANHPNGCITLEDFNGGEGFYKVHLDYLNEKQVEEIEEMIRTWNKESKVPNENIKSCIGMCLTDVGEQRFKDYNTNLKDCLAWLEKQTNIIPNECVFRPLAGTDIKSAAKQAIEQQGVLAKEVVLAFNGAYIPVKGKAQDIIVNEYYSWLEKQGQKPAWSEEDEQYLLVCKNALRKYQVTDKWDSEIISQWLDKKIKSTKQRIGG